MLNRDFEINIYFFFQFVGLTNELVINECTVVNTTF